MNILIINWQDWINPLSGGAEIHLYEIFKRIALKHNVTLFCSQHEGSKSEEIIDGIKIIRRGKRNTFNFIVPFYYKKYFAKENFDIIIDDINKIPFYTPLFIKKPLLAISHHFFGSSIYRESGYIIGSYVNFAEKLVNYIYKKTKFAVVSQSTLDEFIERGFNKDNFSLVPNALAKSEFPMKIGDKYNEPSVAYFGRLKKYKSVDHLVYAFAKIIEKIPNAMLHLIGRGDFKENLELLCRQLGIEKNVIFHGFVDEEEKKRLLSRVHCVVNTSMKEGWGITNIEANACGTPVISADSPGLRDSVKNGVSGLLYKYGDINELYEVIYLLLSEKELNQKLSDGALQWASSFSWDNSAELMLQSIYEVINDFKKKQFLK